MNRGDNRNAAGCAVTQSAAQMGFDNSVSSPIFSIPRTTHAAQDDICHPLPYNEAIVRCLQIAYRRGRAILEAEAPGSGGGAGFRRGDGMNAATGNGAAWRATAILRAAQPGGRHAALYDAAVVLAEAGTDRATAEAFLTAGALAIGLRENGQTRRAIRQGLDKGAASRGGE